MDEKLKILLCEDDENLGMLLREYLALPRWRSRLQGFPEDQVRHLRARCNDA